VNTLPLPAIDDIVRRALLEDVGSGDVTSEACIDAAARSVAHAVARQPLVACGASVAERVFYMLDPALAFDAKVADGEKVERGATLWTVRGSSRAILMGERVALNLVQRMSGIATTARAFVEALAPGTGARITDTRKTTPGLRILERYSVRMGGAKNHRDDLGAAVLIKDNHVRASGGVAEAIRRAKARAPHTSRIECEVDSLDQLEIALAAGADVVLLDNMDDATIARAVAHTRQRPGSAAVLLEASGNVGIDRVRALSEAGVDCISSGALTHSVKAADIGLDFE
jgi:nicotinate-nucleotide pyrophosphorylase (carboxylating)